MGQLLEPIKIICYGPSLTKSIQLAQLQLVLIPVKSLKDILTQSSPIKLAATPLRSLQPGSCCTREVQCCESGLQMISDRIHLEKTFHSGHAKVVGYHHQTWETPIWEVGQSEGENLERNHVGMKMR